MGTNSVIVPGNLVGTWRNCGGYYECPKDADGRRLGPLVGYAGKYDAPDGTKKQYVGEVYWNFADVEEDPEALGYFASMLVAKISKVFARDSEKPTGVLGAPMGGIGLAFILGSILGLRVIYPEKKVTEAATSERREKSELVFGRHEVRPGDRVLTVEDVCNNFSTTEQTIQLVRASGGEVCGIACALNRSLQIAVGEQALPVVAAIHRPTEQWKQEDPVVADDVALGNVVWKVKPEWRRLMEVMRQHAS